LVAHADMQSVQKKAQSYNQRYSTNIGFVDGITSETKQTVLDSVDIALCCAAAGIRVITAAQIAHSSTLKVIADVNAVAPTGAEGVDVHANGVTIAGTQVLGVGALAIGDLKYKTQHNLLKQMLETDKPLCLEFMAAFEMARSLTK
jgi:methylene-tetrahydromethanopterin dehydrogenase